MQGARNIGYSVGRARDYFLASLDRLGGDNEDARRQFLHTFRTRGTNLQGRVADFEKFRMEMRNQKNHITAIRPVHMGKLLMFSYDPKHKETLPYYDRVPLVMPFSVESDRFRGLNFHYLPYPLRAQLMDAIVDNQIRQKRFTGQDDTEDTMRFNYNLMKRAAKSRLFKPCVKEYIFGHVVSDKFLLIPGEEWEEILFMPFHRFEKASAREVWNDSRDQV